MTWMTCSICHQCPCVCWTYPYQPQVIPFVPYHPEPPVWKVEPVQHPAERQFISEFMAAVAVGRWLSAKTGGLLDASPLPEGGER